MFSVFNSPCVFEQIPSFSQPTSAHYFDRCSPMSYSPECKRRKAVKANLTPYKRSGRNESQPLKYELNETPNGCTLSLYKHIPSELISKYVNQKLDELRESHYRPTYHVVQDYFGNQYYVEDEADDNTLLRSALEDLDFKTLGKKIAKDLFQDYEIELNHRGDELSIMSKKDNIFKDYYLDQVFEDVFVISCGVNNIDDDSREKYALLKIGLVKHEKENVAFEIRQPKTSVNELAREQSHNEINSTSESSSEEEMMETKESLTKEDQIKKWIEEERLMQEENRKSVEKKLAKETEERQKKEKQGKLKARKEFLMQKQKARKSEPKKKQNSSPLTTSKIGASKKEIISKADFAESDDESINSESDTNSSSSMPNNTLKKHVSPILEDVEDEEVDRYNESLSRSPRGNSIIEDM